MRQLSIPKLCSADLTVNSLFSCSDLTHSDIFVKFCIVSFITDWQVCGAEQAVSKVLCFTVRPHSSRLLKCQVSYIVAIGVVNTDSSWCLHIGLREPGLAAIGALGIPADESGVGELMELATMKLLQSRQLDHAYGQFVLAAQLYASAHHGASSCDAALCVVLKIDAVLIVQETLLQQDKSQARCCGTRYVSLQEHQKTKLLGSGCKSLYGS